MHHAGSPSWEVRIDRWSQRYDVPLWIRAVERIDVPADGIVPGPLEDDVLPPRGSAVEVDAAHELVEGWVAWWSAVVGQARVVDFTAPPTADPYDPPGFSGLARWSALQQLVQSRWPEIREWNLARKSGGIRDGLHIDGQINSTIRELEQGLGRSSRPFVLDLVLLPVRDDRIRRVGSARYLVPECLWDGARSSAAVRELLSPLV